MSRLCRYKESLQRFIKDRSCLLDKNRIPNANVESIIYNRVKDSDLLLPIMLLTIMNNQNKKNSKTIQGYYAATSVQILQILLDIINDKDAFISNYDSDIYTTIREYLIVSSGYSLFQNLETVKDNFDGELASEIIINSLKFHQENITKLISSTRAQFEVTDQKPCTDVKNWFIKDDKSLIDHFNKLRIINKKSFKGYIDNNLGSVCESVFQIGWVIGCGNQKDLKKIKKIAK